MYGSPALSDDLKLAFPLESDVRGRQMAHAGLVRLRSAPSSLIGEACDEFIPAARPSSPDSLLARFLSSDIHQHDKPTPPSAGQQPPPTSASSVVDHGGTDLVSSQQQQQLMFYGSHGAQASRLSLARQCSSPAGFFSPLNAEIGYGAMKGVSEATLHPGRLHHQLSFSSRQSSLMSQISEIDTKRMRRSSPDETKPGNGNSGSCYIPGFIVGSCDDSSMLCDNSSGLKRAREDADENIIAGLLQTDAQNRNVRNRVPGLSHQVSFPKASSEIAAMEKFLQFQDAVPCKVRAKRGCATHPRSIAERVRRTRISERMRKLQEVVPNMDKQTNTADMLDLAVEHIKNLQKQVKLLSHDRATCACASSKQQLHSSPSV